MPYGQWEPSPKDILIDRVRRGQMTPEQAEVEAGKGSGQSRPIQIALILIRQDTVVVASHGSCVDSLANCRIR
jgi:hypothetical protein